MGLNANQKRAVEYLDGPLLVLAGPGTGKTQLLSSKVAYILKNTDTNPENILCLTFTETGAKNMRKRLEGMVGVKNAKKVTIGTYHAFGTEILAQYKWYTDEFNRNLETAIDEIKQYKIIKEIQENLPGTDILRGDSIKDILGVISEAKAAELTADDLMKIAEQNIEDAKILSVAISPLLEEIVPRKFKESYERAYQPIYEILKKYDNLEPILNNIERTIMGMTRDLKAAILEAEMSEKIKPLTAWKDAYFEKNKHGAYRLKDGIANKKLSSIAKIMKGYEDYLYEHGLFDFNDMIRESVRILEADDGFRMTLQEKYQFILLDEFQDTNPLQFRIIKTLTNYEKPMVMAVGDDDQAIYEFQGALASNLGDFQAYYSSEVIPLVENYRSTQEILDFSQKIISQATDRFADKELIAHKPDPENSQIYRYEFKSSDAEYSFVAKKILELVKSGVKQDEIAIISYKTKYFEPLLNYLKAYPELKIAYEKRDNLFEDRRIHEILTLAELIYEIANQKRIKVSVLEIFTYDWLDLPTLEIVKLASEAKQEKQSIFELMMECENSKIRETATWILELVGHSFNEPLEMFLGHFVEKIEQIFEQNKNEENEYERFRFYENLAALFGKVKKYKGGGSILLGDLIEMVHDYEMAGMGLSVNSPYREANEAVQILTVHKAKGLEFEYVFIISADHTAWGKGKGNNNLLTLPKNLTQIRHTGMTDGEKLRILYVALTRAKSSLYITNSLTDFNDKSPDRLEYLEEYEENGEVISPFLPDKKVKLEYDYQISEEKTEDLRKWFAPYMIKSPEMREIYREKINQFKMSASILTSFIDIIYAGPGSFFRDYILGAPREPEDERMAMGNLIHETFEMVTKKGVSDEEAVEFFLEELEHKKLPEEIAAAIREKGPNDLKIALKEFKDILRSGEAEVDFRTEKLVLDDAPITGKIDHIYVNEEEKTIEVYDFKTGKYKNKKWESDASLYKYMLQLGFYKLLLNLSPRYRDYEVKLGHILFVTPDNYGEVYDKVYEFNEEDEERLKNLIRIVYHKITSLEFLDDSDIFLTPDANRKVSDMKSFIELLLAKGEEIS